MPISKLQKACRLTIKINTRLGEQLIKELQKIGAQNVLIENARCVRQNISKSFFNFGGLKTGLTGVANDIFRLSVPENQAESLLSYISNFLELHNPGRGTAYIKNLLEYSHHERPSIMFKSDKELNKKIMHDLTLITVVLSASARSEQIARVSLRLGAGVPVISLGRSTGIREKMGLLSITIPADKEVLQLLVPAHDSDVLRQLLIDEAYIDRPGGGFIYQVPIPFGIVDPLISIGRQEHAASIEQIIAAIDELKKSTSWRKRFVCPDSNIIKQNVQAQPSREVVCVCEEGYADPIVSAALSLGVDGATVSSARLMQFSEDSDSTDIAVERAILCIPQHQEQEVLSILNSVAEATKTRVWVLQTSDISATFVHRPR